MAARVEEVREAIARGASGSEKGLSDPGLLPTRMNGATETRIDARFGPGFAGAVVESEDGVWSAPIASAYGTHFVRIIERRRGAVPRLLQVRDRVVHEHRRDTEAERVKQALGRMRAAYDIEVAMREGQSS